MRKPILDHPVDVKPLLRKESNEPNIPQKLEFIPAREPDQKLSPPPAAERPTTKATSADGQQRTALRAKDPQRQAQNPDIVYEKAKEAQEMAHEPEDKARSCSRSSSPAYNDNRAVPAIPLSSATQNAAITDLVREYDQGAE